MNIGFTPSEIRAYFAPILGNVRHGGKKEYRGRCPVHNGANLNFVVDSETGLCYCFSKCCRGWDMIGLDQELFGGSFPTAMRRVFATVGRHFEELSMAEWREIEDQRERDRNDLAMAVCWRHARLQQIERILVDEKRYLFNDDAESESAVILVGQHTKRQQQLEGFSSRELLDEFRRMLRENPSGTRELVIVGAEDLEDARTVCVCIIRALEISVSQFPALGVEKLGDSNC